MQDAGCVPKSCEERTVAMAQNPRPWLAIGSATHKVFEKGFKQ